GVSLRHVAQWMAQSPDLVPAFYRILDVTLVCSIDAIETNAVVTATDERYILGMRPAQRHGCSGGLAAFHVGQIVRVPKLFGDHSTLIGKILDRGDERSWIATRSEFVMAAFAS